MKTNGGENHHHPMMKNSLRKEKWDYHAQTLFVPRHSSSKIDSALGLHIKWDRFLRSIGLSS